MITAFPEPKYDLRTALIKWWINSRENGGLRLTTAGFTLLTKMEYASYRFTAKNIAKSINLIRLDRNLECPYYIDGLGALESKIYILGSKEATIIKLYGDVNLFLDTLR